MIRKVCIIILVTLFCWALDSGDWAVTWNNRYADGLMRIHPDRSLIDTGIVYVLITQECLDWAEENGTGWPWPREYYAYLLEYLKLADVRHVFFDFIFAEPSVYGPSDDSVFVSRIVADPERISLGITFTDSPQHNEPITPLHPWLKVTNPNSIPVKSYQGLIPLFQSLHKHGSDSIPLRVGSINFISDADGYNRRIYPLVRYQDTYFPQLAFSGFCAALGIDSLTYSPGRLQWRTHRLPLSGDGSVRLKYYGGIRDYPMIAMRDILSSYVLLYLNPEEGRSPPIPPERLRDKYVLIGSSAPGLKDLRPNPFNPTDPGVHIYGTFLNNLLRHDFLDPVSSRWWVLICLIAAAGLGVMIMTENHLIDGIGWLVVLGIGMQFLFYGIQQKLNLVLPYAGLMSSFILAFLAQTMTSYYLQRQQKRFIQSAFSQLVSPVIMEKLIHNPNLLQLGGTTCPISVFFSDVAGFTSISESLRPNELIKVLNIYLTEVTGIIVDNYQGYIDKYIGDAVMAFWGAPVPDPIHARNACAAAIENQLRMTVINRKLRENGFKVDLSIRIGINSGDAVAGMMGSKKKLNYTVLGDMVNLASRLEGINKYYGTPMMISQSTRDFLDSDFIVREMDLITVKGKQEPTRIFELIGFRSGVSAERLKVIDSFHKGLRLYFGQDFSQAARQFLSLAESDPAAALFYRRCRSLMITPPPSDWNGVNEFQTK
ncbi:MAG: adenylate/guanylate cyclase domain-containing protein [Candidatus Delongbacteria bacterium]|nr:adenylate/guanylate cyclase domain-containing protein [Candidatus Delongbacteria bacterium]